MTLKPVTSEKAVKLIELENTLLFQIEKGANKNRIRKEVEDMFSVKVSKVRTLIKDNKKIAFVQLNKKYPAIDVATKLGMI